MILYKFMSPTGFEKLLENKTLLFTNPKNFNDPFDCEISHYTETNLTLAYHANVAHQSLIYKIGILCLTRNKFNLLMWAHYAANHTGVVVGIDIPDSGLDTSDKIIVRSTDGSIIYTSIRPSSNGEPVAMNLDELTPEQIQKIFLQKSIHWAYEEEVRIVRNNRSDTGGWIPIFPDNKAVEIPDNCIREIYFGARFDFNKKTLTANSLEKRFPKATLSQCDLDNTEWKLVPTALRAKERMKAEHLEMIQRAIEKPRSNIVKHQDQ